MRGVAGYLGVVALAFGFGDIVAASSMCSEWAIVNSVAITNFQQLLMHHVAPQEYSLSISIPRMSTLSSTVCNTPMNAEVRQGQTRLSGQRRTIPRVKIQLIVIQPVGM